MQSSHDATGNHSGARETEQEQAETLTDANESHSNQMGKSEHCDVMDSTLLDNKEFTDETNIRNGVRHSSDPSERPILRMGIPEAGLENKPDSLNPPLYVENVRWTGALKTPRQKLDTEKVRVYENQQQTTRIGEALAAMSAEAVGYCKVTQGSDTNIQPEQAKSQPASVENKMPVTSEEQARPPQTAPTDSKDFPALNACTGISKTPVQASRNKKPVEANLYENSLWRFPTGTPPMPRGFTCVAHLKTEIGKIKVIDGKPVNQTETVTGWQIQASTGCDTCPDRFRPVAGFISAKAFAKMRGVSQDEQQKLVTKAIESRFNAGRVSRRCPSCSLGDRGRVRQSPERAGRNQKA